MDVVKGKPNEGDIRPILMFGQDDCRTSLWNVFFTIDLKVVKAVAPAGDKDFHKTIEETPRRRFS